ncbi:hypothetical protein C3B51_16880 [Pseudoalteromonas rubra]|uniref:Uncharacterized protein n=1 Tax=Pseudoalteromonas rubra TaxID=43658 RepID=A0A4Q7E4X2_9GAMM|nr:hypothetical protein C3B51_16880 [Pseudoalteromonas rubra]
MPVQFDGANMTLTALKISHLEQLNSKIFALLSTLFSRLKMEHLIKQIGITSLRKRRCNTAFFHL